MTTLDYRGQDQARKTSGAVSTWMIVSISLIVAVVATTGATVVAMMNYFENKATLDAQVSAAVTDAKKELGDKLEADFAERDKEPNRQFAGPDDYGALTFDYPKTWSVYIAKDGTSNGEAYEAYLNPITVPPVATKQQFGLRVKIEQKDSDKVLEGYNSLVKKGDLKSSTVTINGDPGTRLQGSFSKDIRGIAVVFKIRDKTVTLQTDADTFTGDFDAIVASVKFNS